MRYFFLFLLITISLQSCQSESRLSDPVEVLSPRIEANNTPLASVSKTTSQPTMTRLAPTRFTKTATAIRIATETAEPIFSTTPEQGTLVPARPSSTIHPGAYPFQEDSQSIEPTWRYRVIGEFPHDSTAYTQGLIVEEGISTLVEGTGRDSSLRRIELQTGNIEQYYALPDIYFGEGITLFEDKIYQLTWRSGVGFIYNSETFEQIGEFQYAHQGWGLTHDGSHLIVSDGTEIIRFWDPVTFKEVRRIAVNGVDGPVTQLNELEYVNGEIWANVWHTDLIARISPKDGRILGWIDLSGLLDPKFRPDPEAVLNGIAYNSESGRIFVTGKYWPTIFEIEIVDPNNSTNLPN
jgi:glutamine cyclotransferase